MKSNKVVLVTAGASGIGRSIAEAFLAAGDSVHICDIDSSGLQHFLKAYPAATGSVTDVSNVEAVEALFDDIVTAHGKLDVLVNNAGIAGPSAPVEDIDISDWNKTIGVDLNAAFYVTKMAVPLLKATQGSIVNMSSNAGFMGCPMRSPYVASKWALIGLTKSWAMELGASNVNVNAICPGSVDGERIENVINNDAQARGVTSDIVRDIYKSQNSLSVFIDADDIAQLAVFLCSTAGKSISGQAIAIDGHTESLSYPDV